MAARDCPSCAEPSEPDARFCGFCGTRIEAPAATAPPAAAPQAGGAPPAALGNGAPLLATVPLPRPPHGTEPTPAPLASAGNGHRLDKHPRLAATTIPEIRAPRRADPAAQAPAARAEGGMGLAAAPARHALPPPNHPLIGRSLNSRYLIEQKIGEGGFGSVFRGRQVATGRPVALKVLHPHNVSDPTVVARFRREAEACSRLTDPHTVTIYDFDRTDDGILYLAMELLRGRPLQDLQREEGPLAPARVVEILDQAAQALGEAHEKGIVHRDMKPENLMIETRDGTDAVKVLDFGIAKLAGSGKPAPALTAIGQTLGTVEFMSPEQLRGQPLDGRSDIYALGMMAYEMLTGTLPFKPVRGPTDIINFHLKTPPPPPSSMRTDLKIPRAIDRVVVKMVAKERSDRHLDTHELRQHLQAVRRSLEGSSFASVGLGIAAIATAVLLAGWLFFR